MAAQKPLIAGNWKMHGRRADLTEISELAAKLGPAAKRAEVLICPPSVYLDAALARAQGSALVIGAQDCSPVADDAARTGEISAAMLADSGAAYVIVGHSERRALLGEDNDAVRRKAEAAQAAGLTPIVCVGETQGERAEGRAVAVVAAQVRASVPAAAAPLVLAYEPVWAIGGARTPTLEEIGEMHAAIGQELKALFGEAGAGVRILYGGSVNPKNAGEIFAVPGVGGALVGRACLKAADFSAIVLAHPAVV